MVDAEKADVAVRIALDVNVHLLAWLFLFRRQRQLHFVGEEAGDYKFISKPRVFVLKSLPSKSIASTRISLFSSMMP